MLNIPHAEHSPQLQNCGANIPVTTGTTLIVQDTFDLRPATPGATITGTIIVTESFRAER
jgi:hypothetical protein